MTEQNDSRSAEELEVIRVTQQLFDAGFNDAAKFLLDEFEKTLGDHDERI